MWESSTRREILLGEVRNNLVIPEYLCGISVLKGAQKMGEWCFPWAWRDGKRGNGFPLLEGSDRWDFGIF